MAEVRGLKALAVKIQKQGRIAQNRVHAALYRRTPVVTGKTRSNLIRPKLLIVRASPRTRVVNNVINKVRFVGKFEETKIFYKEGPYLHLLDRKYNMFIPAIGTAAGILNSNVSQTVTYAYTERGRTIRPILNIRERLGKFIKIDLRYVQFLGFRRRQPVIVIRTMTPIKILQVGKI